MAKYFHMSSGLRGCYIPDNMSVMKFDRYRDLKMYVASEAAIFRDGNYFGLSRKAIAAFATQLWTEAQKAKANYFPYCLPMRPAHSDQYSYGLFGSVATRAEYLEYEKENA